MFLIEFEGHDLTKYNNFLIECSQKDYTNQGTQKHHIIPKKFMGGTDEPSNLIVLNYEDHHKAHLVLASCFPRKNIYRGKNYASAMLILGFVKKCLQRKYGPEYSEHMPDFWYRAHTEISEMLRGENNPTYGVKMSPEFCAKMSEARKGTGMGELNPFYGKKHTEESRKKIKEARANQVFSEETKQKQKAGLLANIKRGVDNPNFGKIWEEIYTPEQLEKIRQKIEENTNKNREIKLNNLPNNIYYYETIINGYSKNFYRLCPNCSDKIYYYSPNLMLYNIEKAEKNKVCCKTCTSNRHINTDWNDYLPKTSKAPIRYMNILDTETNITYPTKKRLMYELKIKYHNLNNLIKSGRFVIIKDTYTK